MECKTRASTTGTARAHLKRLIRITNKFETAAGARQRKGRTHEELCKGYQTMFAGHA